MNSLPTMVGMASSQYIIDGPMGFFGRGKCSMGFVHRDAFDAHIQALRELGKTITVHENHAPVFAVIAPRAEVAA